MALVNNSAANCLICSGKTRDRSSLDGPFRLTELLEGRSSPRTSELFLWKGRSTLGAYEGYSK